MNVALYLLDMHRNMDSDSRRDPVTVVRGITEMVSRDYRSFCSVYSYFT